MAVEPETSPVFTYPHHGSCAWRPDNTLVITDRRRARDATAYQFLYNPDAKTLTPNGQLAYQDWLTDLPPVFDQGITEDTSTSFELFPSPDEHFFVYALQDWTDPYQFSVPMVIVNRSTGKSLIIPNFTVNPRDLDIHWNVGGNAFLIQAYGGYGRNPTITYVSGFETDLSQTRIVPVSSESGFAETTQWSLYQAYDLDSTGQYMLAAGYFYNPDDKPALMRLIVIDMRDLSYEVVAEDRYFITGRFEQPGDHRVVYMGAEGIFAYNRQDKTQELLTKQVENVYSSDGSTYASTCLPTISLDGRFIAFDHVDKVNEVFVVSLHQP
jgi:hypothetical protein